MIYVRTFLYGVLGILLDEGGITVPEHIGIFMSIIATVFAIEVITQKLSEGKI